MDYHVMEVSHRFWIQYHLPDLEVVSYISLYSAEKDAARRLHQPLPHHHALHEFWKRASSDIRLYDRSPRSLITGRALIAQNQPSAQL